MSTAPLTHHEIVELVEPFTRLGRRVDLPSSQRLERRLRFQPVEVGRPDGPLPACLEALQLESLGTGTLRLTRTLTLPDGEVATLQAAGPNVADLLERVCAVAPPVHFARVAGCMIARSYQLGWGAAARDASGSDATMALTQGVVQLGGLRLTMNVASTRGVSADVVLRPVPALPLELPQDLLAVIGWNWARLVPDALGWTSKLRLPGAAQRRRRAAEDALERVTRHLSDVFAHPPSEFHDRHRWARWGVVARRAIPLLTTVALTGAVLALPRVSVERTPGLWVLMFHVPIVLIALSFAVQELSRLEIPPLPRRLHGATWSRETSPTDCAARSDPRRAARARPRWLRPR